MDLLNTLLFKCVKRREMAPILPYSGMCTESRRHLEEMWKADDFRRQVYKNYCECCTCRNDCKLISYRHWTRKNVIINTFGKDENAETEIIVFKEDLKCIDEQKNIEFKGGSNYIDIDGCLWPKDENLRNSKFLENMANSARQSVDKYWGYALSNDWDYFITLTTDKNIVGNRYDDDNIKYYWKKCRRRIQTFDKDAKILLIPERHKDGALHFHGLVSLNRSFILRQLFDPVTKKAKFSKVGTPLFEFPFWDFGFASCAILEMDKSSDLEKKRRVIAYLNKYVMKGSSSSDKKDAAEIGYKQKRFYRTENLTFKTKDILYLDKITIADMTDEAYFIYKESEDRIIYRLKAYNNEH